MGDRAKRRVLIVDDEVTVTRLLKLTLEQAGGFDVHVANSGRDGLDAARALLPDVMLVDVLMPDMTGPEVVARIRGEPAFRQTAIIYLTAAIPQERPRPHVDPAGWCPWLPKPVRTSAVIECIEQELQRRARLADASASGPSGA